MTDPIARAIRAGCDAGGWTHGCRYPKCEDDGPTHGCSRPTEIKAAIAAYEAKRATDASDLEKARQAVEALPSHCFDRDYAEEIAQNLAADFADARQAAAREMREEFAQMLRQVLSRDNLVMNGLFVLGPLRRWLAEHDSALPDNA